MDIQYNDKGVPLMISSNTFFASTVGSPADSGLTKKDVLNTWDLVNKNRIYVDNYSVIPWGTNNKFPQEADAIIGKVAVLNSGLKFLRNLTLGQGIFACTVEGTDDNGNEILKPIDDQSVKSYVQSRQVRRYMETALRDFLKFGSANVAMHPSLLGTNFAGIQPLNALFTRTTQPDANGVETCILSGKWPMLPGAGDYSAFEILNQFDPELDLFLRLQKGKLKQPLVYSIRDSWSNNDTYSEPIWKAALTAGWIDIAASVPAFLKKAYANQITWKYHIQIPYSYWDKRHPEANYKDVNARKAAINAEMDAVERNLCGPENAERPLFTHYAVNEANGKIEEEWKIEAIDNKQKEGDKLVTSAAANSEILFSLLVNPNVMGAGMPGGAYAGNSGGSNIREAFLVNIANAWLDRQNILDPIELYLKSNGVKDAELRFRNTILVTLDQGSGTKKVLS